MIVAFKVLAHEVGTFLPEFVGSAARLRSSPQDFRPGNDIARSGQPSQCVGAL